MPFVVDLNADVGEECGDDAGLLGIVTTANVAAGGHAGGGDVLLRTVELAARAGVAVGAHPSYPDRADFGRISRADAHDRLSITAFVREQVLTVAAACAEHRVGLSHVKAHGALYHDAAAGDLISSAFLDGVELAARDLGGSGLPVMGMPGTALDHACRQRGAGFIAEAFADRAYAPDGSLVPRNQPGAVLDDPVEVAERVLRLVTAGYVTAVDGIDVRVPAATICVHGDTPGAVEMARRVRHRLEESGVVIAAPGAHA